MQPHIGNIGTPHVVHPCDRYAPQSTRLEPMRRGRFTEPRCGRDGLSPQCLEQPRDPFGMHGVAVRSQPHGHPASPIEGRPGVLCSQPAHQRQIFSRLSCGSVVGTRP
jgi:hypothetical protein